MKNVELCWHGYTSETIPVRCVLKIMIFTTMFYIFFFNSPKCIRHVRCHDCASAAHADGQGLPGRCFVRCDKGRDPEKNLSAGIIFSVQCHIVPALTKGTGARAGCPCQSRYNGRWHGQKQEEQMSGGVGLIRSMLYYTMIYWDYDTTAFKISS